RVAEGRAQVGERERDRALNIRMYLQGTRRVGDQDAEGWRRRRSFKRGPRRRDGRPAFGRRNRRRGAWPQLHAIVLTAKPALPIFDDRMVRRVTWRDPELLAAHL